MQIMPWTSYIFYINIVLSNIVHIILIFFIYIYYELCILMLLLGTCLVNINVKTCNYHKETKYK